MKREGGFTDVHHRLDELERRLAEKESEISGTGAGLRHHQDQIDDLYAKARALREKLVQPEETRWEAVGDEVEADWEILKHSFERWVAHVDEDFRSRQS